MIMERTAIDGAYVLRPVPHVDERGSFARTFCAETFLEYGLDHRVAQCSISTNRRRGTLRGLHLQRAPFGETKVVRCMRGAIYDVMLDLRETSRTFGRWVAVVLNEENGAMVYIPEGVAHGFQTLVDETSVAYSMSTPYAPAHQVGVRFDDPRFRVTWPVNGPILSARDAAFPPFDASNQNQNGRAA